MFDKLVIIGDVLSYSQTFKHIQCNFSFSLKLNAWPESTFSTAYYNFDIPK